jgi:tRNA uridine 5-carbamoylmethylation protein Kti12
LYFTIGLPGSGKSTTARRMVAESGGTIREVTKDDLRLRPEAPKSRGKQERWVVAERDRQVIEAFTQGCSIVVHDTNFNPVHRTRLEAIAAEYGANFEVLDFTHVDVHECIRRDAGRPQPVGEKVIREMWQRYLRTPPTS